MDLDLHTLKNARLARARDTTIGWQVGLLRLDGTNTLGQEERWYGKGFGSS